MIGDLIERDRELVILEELLVATSAGQGRVALVFGDAGVGKTALIERFLVGAREQRKIPPRVLYAACDALFTPRPFGPLYDIAEHAAPHLLKLLEGQTPLLTRFGAMLDELTRDTAILIIEDIHWADEATLDVLKYVTRRIRRTSTLLILTYRDDELPRDHPLRFVLSDLPSRDSLRIPLSPLSQTAVSVLARKVGRSGEELYRVTGGNPFFLSEVIASRASGVPASVADAVLAKIARRSPAAQRLLEFVAVVPNKIEQWLLEACDIGQHTLLEECLAANILHCEERFVGFRHELARQAVEETLTPLQRRTLHAQVLHALLSREGHHVALARLVHHAAYAEDEQSVLQFAPQAAREAARQGAHREATAHYQTALRFAEHLNFEQRAILLEESSYESYLTEHVEDAVATCTAAMTLWRALHRTELIGRDLRLLANYHWVLGKSALAEHFALEAVEVLEGVPPSHELAMTYAMLSGLHSEDPDATLSLQWGQRALHIAEPLHDVEGMSYALNSMGCAELSSDEASGLTKLDWSLRLAKEHGLEKHVARAYANLASCKVRTHDFKSAKTYLEEGLAYCTEHELDIGIRTLQGERARMRLDQGNWSGAEEDANAIVCIPWVSVANQIPALIVLGVIQARRGDSQTEMTLDVARNMALDTGNIQYILPMAAARAEWRWLQGDHRCCVDEAKLSMQTASRFQLRWQMGDIAVWLWRCGSLKQVPADLPTPHALQIAGEWRASAATWEELGCPYEQALVLLDGDESAQRIALSIFEQLEAGAAAAIARRRLRERGVRGLRRGTRLSNRTHPLELTQRQFEVLLLLAEGLHNHEIAQRLSNSPKTIERHVTALLARLQVRSRTEAVRRAFDLGLLAQTDHSRDFKLRE